MLPLNNMHTYCCRILYVLLPFCPVLKPKVPRSSNKMHALLLTYRMEKMVELIADMRHPGLSESALTDSLTVSYLELKVCLSVCVCMHYYFGEARLDIP